MTVSYSFKLLTLVQSDCYMILHNWFGRARPWLARWRLIRYYPGYCNCVLGRVNQNAIICRLVSPDTYGTMSWFPKHCREWVIINLDGQVSSAIDTLIRLFLICGKRKCLMNLTFRNKWVVQIEYQYHDIPNNWQNSN